MMSGASRSQGEVRILITCPPMVAAWSDLEPHLCPESWAVTCRSGLQTLSEEDLIQLVPQFDGWIAGDDPASRSVLTAGARGRLKAVVKWGIGVDAIDRAAATELGVGFANTPGVFGDEVADVALGYVLMLARRLHEVDRSVKEGGWLKPVGISLRGKTLGVIGLGSIGQAIARRGSAFGMRVIGADVVQVEDWAVNWTQGNLDEVFSEADFLVLACGLTQENRHLINEETLGRLKPGTFLINVARGPLIDEEALARRLSDGWLGGVALDVFEEEPLPMNSPLRGLQHCIFGSHNGSNTAEAVDRVNRLSVDLLFDLLQSDKP